VTGAAAHRTAIVAALAEHADDACAPYIQDAAFVDGFFALSCASEHEVDDAALAVAAAEGDDVSALLARVLLAARGHMARSGGSDNEDSCDRGTAERYVAGVRIRALLDAASADDEESVVRWLASPAIGLDVAQVRAAQIACKGLPLRMTLAQALNSFRGREVRDRAMRAARALRAVAVAIEPEDAELATIAHAAVVAMDSFEPAYERGEAGAVDVVTLAAAAADLVWKDCAHPPPARERLRLLLDASSRADAEAAEWPMADPSFMNPGAERSYGRRSQERSGQIGRGASASTAADGGADEWEWPVPEPPRVAVAPPMTFSASRLNSFVKCGRRWFFEYLCDAVEDRGSIHATYGKVVHQALETLHRDIREPSAVDARAIADRFLREIDIAFGMARSDFESQFEYEVSRLQARRAAPKYVDWLVKQAAAAPMEIVEVESINRLRAGGHDFVGYIDRIDRPLGGGAVTIFDYKTGRVPDDPRSYLESVRRGEEAQLALYYFMRRSRGDDVARVALVSIRDIHDDVRVLALDIVEEGATRPPARPGTAACTRAVLDASLAAIIRRCDLITREGVTHFAVGEDPPCRFCAYFSACRERPPEPESIFVR
jgi:RecB family exonuclease